MKRKSNEDAETGAMRRDTKMGHFDDRAERSFKGRIHRKLKLA